jgi:hypothetical protein
VACVQHGHLVHRIAATPEIRPGDARITMQGHAIRVNDRFVLYW